jgi:dihydrofolate reductase
MPSSNGPTSQQLQKEKRMRKIITTTWVTLDGFIAGPNEAMDWVMVDQEMGQYEDDIYGSASVVRALTNHGLIDEYQLLVHPVILGAGKPLFQDITEKQNLELVKTKPFPSGVMGLYYRPRGK